MADPRRCQGQRPLGIEGVWEVTNRLAEALYGASGSRTCLRDHSPMVRQPGVWVLQQVERSSGLLTDGDLRPTGKLLTMETYVCAKCGHVELVNEGGA